MMEASSGTRISLGEEDVPGWMVKAKTKTGSWTPSAESDEQAGLLSPTIKKRRMSSKLPFSISPRALSSLVAMLQSVEVLCNLAILYLFKDDFQIDPASVTVVMGCLRIPWTVKPLWALMADNCSLYGSRRKSYIIVGAAACMAATLGIGLGGYRSFAATTSLLLLYFWGSAVCNVIGEALVVEAGREGSTPGATARTVSTFFAFRKISFATMSYLSGLLLAYIDKRFMFIIAAALPFMVFAAAFFLEEPHVQPRPIREQISELIRVVKKPVLLNSTLFTFIMMSTPSAGSIMFYFMTNELHFGPELLGRLALFQSVAALLGIMVYMYCCSGISIRTLLIVSTLAVTPFCLLPVVVIERWNVTLGIPDTAFVVTDSVLMEFVGEFQTMPVLVLAARLCPRGLESTIYSLLLSAYNLGLGLGSLVSAGLTAALGISATNFSGLTALTVICALSNLLPLCVIWMIPGRDEELAIASSDGVASVSTGNKAERPEESDSTIVGSDEESASSPVASDIERGASRSWRWDHPGLAHRRATVQVVDGDSFESSAPQGEFKVDAQDAAQSLRGRCPAASSASEARISGGSGECASPRNSQW